AGAVDVGAEEQRWVRGGERVQGRRVEEVVAAFERAADRVAVEEVALDRPDALLEKVIDGAARPHQGADLEAARAQRGGHVGPDEPGGARHEGATPEARHPGARGTLEED